MDNSIDLGPFILKKGGPLTVISGPCVIESRDHTLKCAERLKQIGENLGINIVFKASFDKANRSAISSFRGPGRDAGLKILSEVKSELNMPTTTDVHTPDDALAASECCDILQIPAFLCRQTDLVVAAAKTGKPVNIKKGQFLAPWDMQNVVDKCTSTGNTKVILTERGTSFGYNNLVTDMRAIPVMKQMGPLVCFDASHSVQLPGGRGTSSGGQREFIPCLTHAALAAGADLLFIESHPDPENALSDAGSVFPLEKLEAFLKNCKELHALCQNL